ncbi:hypothetical protein E4099_26800 [Streptomyces palmae]|uniref:Uncharacterized protein n=1 Tax=Streptomyces palmae TaxID=1701085 RepID=A0A4Z0GAE9_9ACTN|nr:hypothetical protein E4099_26800 [Streptomyces palmae]
MASCRRCGGHKRRWPRACARCGTGHGRADAAADVGELAGEIGLLQVIGRGIAGVARSMLRILD